MRRLQGTDEKGICTPFAFKLGSNQDTLEPEHKTNYEDLDCDDVPVDLTMGKAQCNRLMQMETINNVLRNTG
jgi:hypothetical protein